MENESSQDDLVGSIKSHHDKYNVDIKPPSSTELGKKYGRSKTIARISYESEVEVIKRQIGDIEEIRFRLGLSARKMAQLLMVDPSAWTRWSKKITQPPPHIYRALQWYLTLQEKNPGFTPQVFLASHWHSRLPLDTNSNQSRPNLKFHRIYWLGFGLFIGVLLGLITSVLVLQPSLKFF